MINVVKIGGNVIDNPEALRRFSRRFAALQGPKVLIHGGGKEATRLSSALNIPTTMIEGRRVTDADTLEVVTMVYAGLVNKRVVSRLQAEGCRSIGLCGADASVITSTRRPPVTMADGSMVDYGYVGDINAVDGVDARFLSQLLDAGIAPVICAITSDGAGQLLNTNADSVAAAVAEALAAISPTRLIYCFEKPGVMLDVDNPASVIPRIDASLFASLKEQGVVDKGMIPKISNSLKAVSHGVSSVAIISADNLGDNLTGTIIL